MKCSQPIISWTLKSKKIDACVIGEPWFTCIRDSGELFRSPKSGQQIH